MPSRYLSSTRLHSREGRQLRRLCMTYLISREPLRALEEPRPSTNHILVNVVGVGSTGDDKVRVVARFKQTVRILVFGWMDGMMVLPLERAQELFARLFFRHVVVDRGTIYHWLWRVLFWRNTCVQIWNRQEQSTDVSIG